MQYDFFDSIDRRRSQGRVPFTRQRHTVELV